jgi:concanavalin A-like lectin/glucanase superfamily protein
MALVSHWEFNDLTDSVGANDLTLLGASSVSATAAKVGGSGLIAVNASGGSRTAFGTVPITAAAGSICLWVQPKGAGDGGSVTGIMSFGNGTNNVNLGRALDGSGVTRCSIFNVGNFNSATVLTQDVWKHFALTWDAGTHKVYVDGVEVNSGSHTTPTTPADGFVVIGGLTNGASGVSNGCNAWLDDARLYDHALSPAEVAALAGLGGGLSVPVARHHYRRMQTRVPGWRHPEPDGYIRRRSGL